MASAQQQEAPYNYTVEDPTTGNTLASTPGRKLLTGDDRQSDNYATFQPLLVLALSPELAHHFPLCSHISGVPM